MFRVNTTLSRPNIPRTIRFSEEIFNLLLKIASSENISFNSMVLQCCKYAIDNYQELDEKTKNEEKI